MKTLFDFEGRIGRKKFTLVFLATSVIYALMALIVMYLRDTYFASLEGENLTVFLVLTGVLLILPALIQLSSMAKRLHDFNKSGFYILTGFIPVLQIITIPLLILVLIFKKGDLVENKYGQINSGN